MKIFSELDAERIRMAQRGREPETIRREMIEFAAALEIIEGTMGPEWLETARRGGIAPTVRDRSRGGGRNIDHGIGSPLARLRPVTTDYDRLRTRNFAQFLAELVTNCPPFGFERKLEELRRLPFWATYHEVRTAAYFLRGGWGVDFPDDDPSETHRDRPKAPDFTAIAPSLRPYSVECKRNLVPVVELGALQRAALNALRKGADQVTARKLPGVVVVQIQPTWFPGDADKQSLFRESFGRIKDKKWVIGAAFFLDYMDETMPQSSEPIKGMTNLYGFIRADAPESIREELGGFMSTIPGQRHESLLSY